MVKGAYEAVNSLRTPTPYARRSDHEVAEARYERSQLVVQVPALQYPTRRCLIPAIRAGPH